MRKITTGCCALCQLDKLNNKTSEKDIKNVLDNLKIEMEANTEVGITTGNGQTATFTIVSPGEDILENNLINLGYVHVHSFSRRKGYPELGDLKLYIKNL